MATFLLVHGAWHGGWCWTRVAKLLRGYGHDVCTPTLTGLGERSHLDVGCVNLSLHIDDVLNVIKFEQLSDIILCGHSYGGMIVTGVADRVPERIRALVYLDAFLPEDGKSLWDYVGDHERVQFLNSLLQNAGHHIDPIRAEIFNVNEGDRLLVNEMCVAMPPGPFFERIFLSGRWGSIVQRRYVYATGWRGPFAQFYERVSKDPSWSVITVRTGHHIMLDDPETATRILVDAAQASQLCAPNVD